VFGEPQARCAAERDLKQLVDAGLAQLRAGAGHEQFTLVCFIRVQFTGLWGASLPSRPPLI
jgi:hypothetical protein